MTTNTNDVCISSKHLAAGEVFHLTWKCRKALDVDVPEGRRLVHRFLKELAGGAGGAVKAPIEREFIAHVRARREAAEARKDAAKAKRVEQSKDRAQRALVALQAECSVCVVRPASSKIVALVGPWNVVTHLSDGVGTWEIARAPKALREVHARMNDRVAKDEIELDQSGLQYRKITMPDDLAQKMGAAHAESSLYRWDRIGRELRLLGVLPGHVVRDGQNDPILVFSDLVSPDCVCLAARLVGKVAGSDFYGKGRTSPVIIKRPDGSVEMLQPVHCKNLGDMLPV